MSAPLNILYIHSHDTGRYVQPYGHPVSTPNLQAFAEEGVLFRQAFCANPTCSPSRSCLLTGQYAHNCGMFGLVNRGFEMPDYSKHIVQVLKKAGYHTVLSGIQHEAKSWETIGYERNLGNRETAHANAAEFLRHAPEEPFFLSVGFFETHRQFPELTDEDAPDYTMPPTTFPDTPETRVDFARYKKSAEILDEKMGMVFSALDQSGLADRTLVICTTDHGLAFPRMKCNLTDGGIGVMLMMRGPGGFDGGKVIDAMVSHIDIVPTVCDLVGIAVPKHAQGISMLPLVRGEVTDIRKAIFAEVNFHGSNEPARCVRTKRWKYIRRFYGDILPSCDGGETRTLWLNSGWDDRPQPEEMLYDLTLDPCEMNNLAFDPYFAPVVNRLKTELDRWMQETDDPILSGPLTPPPTHTLPDRPVSVSDAKIPLEIDL